jgi:phosphoribosyl 1,2-cyclic phosphodiesterase
MILRVLASSSAGNGYLLTSGSETLIIEAGVRFSSVKNALNFDIRSIQGLVVSHAHQDHSKYIKEYMKAGIVALAHHDVFIAHNIPLNGPQTKIVQEGRGYKMGGFKILPLAVEHDVPCLAYHIQHQDMGSLLFVTDSYCFNYEIPGLNHVLIEANYADDILDRTGTHPAMRQRLMLTHLSLEATKNILKSVDLAGVMNIILLHLSNEHSDEARFVREIIEQTGKSSVHAARPGLVVDLSLMPY